jgi:hypothetical protein
MVVDNTIHVRAVENSSPSPGVGATLQITELRKLNLMIIK